jgi:hypothetical protein
MKQRRLTLILIFSICVNFGFSQNDISNLDTKYGLNKFKFEDPYTKYKNQTKLIKDSGTYVPHKKDYYYTGKDIDKILEHSVSKIELTFYKEKLQIISVTFDDNLTDYQNRKIYEKLENLFGIPTLSFEPGKDGGKFGYAWIAKKTQLIFSQQEGYFKSSHMMISSRKNY